MVAIVKPETSIDIAVVCRPSGAMRMAITMVTPNSTPWQQATTRRAASSIQ
ncbi:hypothetical protein D3C83_336380 [compost metagenome]